MNKMTTFYSERSQQTLQIYEKFAIITQNWHKAKFCFTCFSGPLYLINGIQYEKKSIQPSWRYTRGQIDRWTNKLAPFLYSPIPLRQGGE